MFGDESTLLIPNKKRRHPGFTIGRKWHLSFTFVAIFMSILDVFFASGQSIGLVLFLGSFQELTGLYFVVFFCSLSVATVLSLLALWFGYKKQITRSMLSFRWIKYMLIVSVFDAANAFLNVFSSHGSRVPPALSSILTQSVIPFTFIFSKLLLPKKYKWLHIFSVCLVLIGVAFSLIPTFKRIHDGTTSTKLQEGWYWPFILIISCIPSSLMSIFQEKLQMKYTQQAKKDQEKVTRFSVVLFQGLESTFQLSIISLCFALDLIPNFGTSDNIDKFWTSFSNGFRCLVNDSNLPGGRCNFTGPLGLLTVTSYVGLSIIGPFLTDHLSANWLSILSSISPLIATSFWFIFPAINEWAGVGKMDAWDIGFSLGALPIIIVGMFLYGGGGTDGKTEEEEDIIHEEHPLEVFW